MLRNLVFYLLFLLILQGLNAQNFNNVELSHMRKDRVRKVVQLPDIPGYKTLKCDFHMHTIFSDGQVWPTIRVDEAWAEGLDAIAITDHIEYLPHKDFLTSNHNTPYEIAKSQAENLDLILIRGGEITRSMPPGHLNGIFLKNVNALDTPEAEDALQAVVDQDGFIFWNHPGWKAQQPDTCLWWDKHQELLEKGLIHGIEVFNSQEYYPVAIDWCVEKDLAMIGNTDVHGLISTSYDIESGHRPMTLVFARERTEESIKEAMFANRTVAWFDDKMIGREELLEEFLKASIELEDPELKPGSRKPLKVRNNADMPFILLDENGNRYLIPPLAESYLNLPGKVGAFKVVNLITGMDEYLGIGYDEFLSF